MHRNNSPYRDNPRLHDPSPSPPESPQTSQLANNPVASSFFSGRDQARSNVYGRPNTQSSGGGSGDRSMDDASVPMNLGRQSDGYGHAGVGGSVGSMASSTNGDGWREAGGTAHGGLGALGEEESGSRLEVSWTAGYSLVFAASTRDCLSSLSFSLSCLLNMRSLNACVCAFRAVAPLPRSISSRPYQQLLRR
jgi:hypothetical protein